MERVAAIVARHFGGSGAELHVGGVPITDVVEAHGTPLYVYAGDALDRQWQRLRSALPPEFSICYSAKANPNPAIISRFVALDCGVEIASAGEFHLATRAGCPPERILFAGPGKTDAELEIVLKGHIGEIHAESRRELERLVRIGNRLGVRVPVALRVNPGEEAQGGAMRMGGKPAPFGIDEETLDDAVDSVLATPVLDLRGVHLFTGTQILDHAVLLRQYGKGLAIAERVARRTGRPLATVDFGGGLGVVYFPGEHDLDVEEFGVGLAELVRRFLDGAWFAGTRFLVEPGRYLVAEAGVYVARVVDVKTSRGKTFVVLDGGMNHHLAASGNLGQIIKRSFPIAALTRLTEGPAGAAEIVGPLCTPLDTLARELPLARVGVGDLVGVFQSGAYARAASPLGFLSHPAPPEVLVDHGAIRLIRRRGTIDDLFRDLPD
jgi:diaminopimelate decarboxylase